MLTPWLCFYEGLIVLRWLNRKIQCPVSFFKRKIEHSLLTLFRPCYFYRLTLFRPGGFLSITLRAFEIIL